MKRVKLINDPAELVALFRAVDSEGRRNVLTTLAEGWTMISDLVSEHGEEAYGAITYFEKFKLVESRWEVNSEISTSLTFDETKELLTVVLMTEKKFKSLEAKIVELIGSEGTFANDVARDLGVTSLTLKGLVRRSVEFDFKGHNIVPLKEEE